MKNRAYRRKRRLSPVSRALKKSILRALMKLLIKNLYLIYVRVLVDFLRL